MCAVRRAVIDVGSNSVLLLVEEWDDRWRVVHEESAITALGEGTKQTGRLAPEAMEKTLQAIRDQFEQAHVRGAESVVAAATMAARIAQNQDEFLRLAEAQGTPVTVLSGEDEARLGFEAVAYDPLFAPHQELAIVDPGGHSTELMVGRRDGSGWQPSTMHSFPVGTLGLKTDVMPSESPGPEEIIAAAKLIDETIASHAGIVTPRGPVVVLGATGTNLASIGLRLEGWQPERVHGHHLTFELVSRAVGWMMPMTNMERAGIVGMEPGRERTLHIGALILERFLHALRVEGCTVSVRGWRHALLEGKD
jgi:exopolyphosphatase/guanosine-5'-triphosphate,3'-diphosphate pyrophosphatase